MKKRACLWVVLAFLAATSLPAPLEGKTYIDIGSPGFRSLPMAVAEVDPETEGGSCRDPALSGKIAKVLLQDLDISGYFQILPPESYLLESKDVKFHPDGVDFRAWALIGAESLVLYRTRCEGDQVVFEAQLLDVLTSKLLTWKKYRAAISAFRAVAHRFANEIEKELTGVPGVFDTRIAYVSRATGAKELYVMDFDGYGARRITSLKSICVSPCWSPDGRRLAFTSFFKSHPSVYVLDLAGGSELRRICGTFYRLCSGAAWSPDGKWIAFSASVEGNSELFRTPWGGGGASERLTNDWGLDVSPSWSPDGKQMVFVSDRAGHPDLYILDVETRQARRLTFEGNYSGDPDWSPRGDWIAFSSRVDGEFQIFRIRPDGTDRTQVTYGPGDAMSPSWSPNGRLLAFSSNQAGNQDIYLVRIDGSGRRRITWESQDDSDPAWSPRPTE